MFDKARNVTAVIYEEDLPSYGALLEHLDSLHIPCAVSPLHDADTFTEKDVQRWVARHTDKETGKITDEAIMAGLPSVGQHKKPHYHVLLRYPGPVDALRCSADFSELVDIRSAAWQKVGNVDSMLRYFAHLDSPEKTRYNALEIKGFGGIDLSALLRTSKVSNLSVLLDVMDHMMKHKIRHYNQLVKWALSTADMDTISCVTGRASFFANYFKAASDERREKEEREKAMRERHDIASSMSESDDIAAYNKAQRRLYDDADSLEEVGY